jgi:hypothetical protein
MVNLLLGPIPTECRDRRKKYSGSDVENHLCGSSSW